MCICSKLSISLSQSENTRPKQALFLTNSVKRNFETMVDTGKFRVILVKRSMF